MNAFIEGNNASVTVFYKDSHNKPTHHVWHGKGAKEQAEVFAKQQLQNPDVNKVVCKSQCVLCTG